MSPQLLDRFDELIARKGYATRSEAIRDIVRNYIVESQWESSDADVVGTVTLVYDHGTRDLSEALTDLQHEHCAEIICATHVHLDEHNCLETIVMRGTSAAVRAVADRLVSTKGVKHGRLICTTTGQGLV